MYELHLLSTVESSLQALESTSKHKVGEVRIPTTERMSIGEQL